MASKWSNRWVIGLIIGISTIVVLGGGILIGYFAIPPRSCESTEDSPKVWPLYAEYSSAAVAADAGPCSVIGKDILVKGGSVVDAGIAAMLCVGLLNAHSTGIGGGSFMNIYDAVSGETIFINCREVAPLSASTNMYNGNSTLSRTGASAIAVPGEIAGYWEAHKRFGKLPWKELFEPTIKLASEGFEINSALGRAILSRRSTIKDPNYNLESIFTNADGTLKKEGDSMTRPVLAATLRTIASKGGDVFYNGSLAELILKDIKDAPGLPSLITKEDLIQYRVETKPLINITMSDLTLLAPGPPSGGPVLCLILNILKGYGFNKDSVKDIPSKVLTYHRIIEAFKFAYAKRTLLGDENFDSEITQLVKNMTSDWYAEEMRMKINDSYTQPTEYYEPQYYLASSDMGTSHLSIVGEDGSAIALTSTINTYFGSNVRGLRTGIIFNNEMDDFSFPNITNVYGVPPSPTNFAEPGKRPLSSMTPTILISKQKSPVVSFVVGASGGTKITTGTALTIMNDLWFEKSLDEAVSMERVHHQVLPEYVQYEEGFDQDILDGLLMKNHSIKSFAPGGSVVQAIARQQLDKNAKIEAKCDERKSGYPDGY